MKIGDIFQTNTSGFCTVIEYKDCKNVRVRFEDGTEITCQAGNLRNGLVKDPSLKFCSIGFIGVGIYSYTSHKRIYMVWIEMLKRCYDEGTQLNNRSYIGCTVCEKWFNFQNFAHDYLLMIGSDLNWELDKDILFKGNKLYSPETCCLVPSQINKLLTKSDASRGEFHIGVFYDERYIKPYLAHCSIKGKQEYLGSYKTEHEAHQAYKIAKETEIKRLANVYKDQLDRRVYIALMNYEVEITD
jgi:hypothetical protein